MLRPDFMFREGFVPTDASTLEGSNVDPLSLVIRVLGARHLSRGKSGRGIVSPFVEVEVCGAPYDCAKYKTKTISDNGLCPVWDEMFNFRILNPDLAFLRYSFTLILNDSLCFDICCIRV